MNNEQARNRNAWDQIYRNEDLETYVPEGYAPAQVYTPIGAQNGYSDYQDSTASPYSTQQTQGENAHTFDDDEIPEEEIRDFVSARRQKRKSKSRAKPKEEQPKSKRAERREKVANEHHGEVSATDQPKGLVEWRDGVFQWWDPEVKEWLKAAYHDQYRDQFIREDRTEGTYVVAPDRGKGPNDITSVCSAYNQLVWRLKDRDSWDNIVDADGNSVLYLLERPESQSYDEPERLWIHDGCVLLDGDNNPVRPWAGIPRCFSSKIEGGRIEALRRILPMTVQDFRARMLRAVPTGAGIGASTKPLSLPSTFGHRSSRFRAQYQCPAWIARAASGVLKQQVLNLLPDAEEATTTAGLQVLSTYEVNKRKLSTRGKYLYKGNGRAISEGERRERDRKFNEKLERQASREPRTPRRPQSMPATPWPPTSPSPYLPTPPLSAGNKRHREDDGLENFGVGQSEPAAKRGRLGASPLGPGVQSRIPSSQMVPEGSSQEAPSVYDSVDIISTNDPHHGQSLSNAIGLGLNFGGANSVNLQNYVPSQNTGLPEPLPQQSQATNTEGTASTNDSQNHNSQLDYRFVDPQNPLEQLRIQAALFYPRAHYYALIGEHALHTSEGTYADQYLQISALLAQKWMVEGEIPSLADIGTWNGSFNMVPTPFLPEGVLWVILHPNPGALPAPEVSTHAQGSSVSVGAENVETGLERDTESVDWIDDLFGENFEDVENADEDVE